MTLTTAIRMSARSRQTMQYLRRKWMILDYDFAAYILKDANI